MERKSSQTTLASAPVDISNDQIRAFGPDLINIVRGHFSFPLMVCIFAGKKMRINLCFALLTLLLSACGPSADPANKPAADELKGAINVLEEKLAASLTEKFDTTSALALVAKVEQLHQHYPDDPATGRLLFRAADVARGAGEFEKAVVLWGLVNQEYEDFDRSAEALFLQGFTADQDLRDPERAKRYYRYFIQRHPQHELIKDAQFLLDYLETGQSAEELIRQFEEQNNRQ